MRYGPPDVRALCELSGRRFLSASVLMGRSTLGLGCPAERGSSLCDATLDVGDFDAVGDSRIASMGARIVLVEDVTTRTACADGPCCRRVRIANSDMESTTMRYCLKASFVRLDLSGRQNDSRLTGTRKDGRMMKVGYLRAAIGLASIVVLGAVGTAEAKDEWFVLSEQTIKATDPSVRITAEEGKWIKEDVKDVRLSVEGADVELNKVILHWNNRKGRHRVECRNREGGRTNGCEVGSRTRGDPQVGDDQLQNPWQCTVGQGQSLGIRLSGV